MKRTHYIDPEIRIVGDIYQGADGEFRSDLIIDGKTKSLLLGFDLAPAEDHDLQARLKLRDRGLLAVVQTEIDRKLQCNRPKPIATFRDVAEAHDAFNFTKINPTTAQLHWCAFFRVAETVWRARHGENPIFKKGAERIPDDFTVADQPLTIIDDNFATDYETARVKELIPGSPAWTKARVMARVDLKWFRRMFTHEARGALEAAGLNIPPVVLARVLNLNDALARLDGPPEKIIDVAHVIKMHELLWALASGLDELLFLIFALALLAGVRHDEIATLHRSALQKSAGFSIVLRNREGEDEDDGEDGGPKGGHQREIPIPRWFYNRLLAWFARQPDGCLISPGPGREAYMELTLWFLRQHGGGDNPLHQLRRYFAGYLIGTCDELEEIRGIFGHDDLATMWKYYTRYPLPDSVCALTERILPSPPRRVRARRALGVSRHPAPRPLPPLIPFP